MLCATVWVVPLFNGENMVVLSCVVLDLVCQILIRINVQSAAVRNFLREGWLRRWRPLLITANGRAFCQLITSGQTVLDDFANLYRSVLFQQFNTVGLLESLTLVGIGARWVDDVEFAVVSLPVKLLYRALIIPATTAALIWSVVRSCSSVLLPTVPLADR